MTLNTPPKRGVNPQTNGLTNGDGRHSAYFNVQNLSAGGANINDGNGEPLLKPRYPHIKDLQATANAAIGELSAFTPVCFWQPIFLDRNETLLDDSNALLPYRFVPCLGVHSSRQIRSTSMSVSKDRIVHMWSTSLALIYC